MDFIERFRAALKIPTYWPVNTDASANAANTAAEEPLVRFQEFLAAHYPAFHRAAERRVLSPYSLLYRWPSATASADASADAVLFVAHYDVVGAETEKWSVDPFGAEMKDGFIYGRGSLDMKSILISLIEAAENLCDSGFRPAQDIWFSFSGDEERAGCLGAKEAAKWFAGRGQRFSWVLDEGTPIAENQIEGIDAPLALVSIEEKGFLSLELAVSQEPGHASRPPRVQAAALLARALCRIAARPFPCKLVPTVENFFKEIAPLLPGPRGFVMRHARAFGPFFSRALAGSPALESLLRTTAAMTQLQGSAADNVMPSQVRAVINLRLLCPWTVKTAIAFIEQAIGDKRVRVSVHGLASEPVAPAADWRRKGWPAIEAAVNKAWPGVPLLPFIMVATTDSRHYEKLAGPIFRFNPHKLDSKESGGVHGHDERVSIENLQRGLVFYTKLLESL